MSTLPSSEHEDQMNLVSVLNGFGKLVGMSAGMVDIDFNDMMQFIFSGKDRLFHPGILPDEVVQAFPDGLSLHGHDLPAVGITAMCRMNVYLNGHVLLLVPE
jgi:hypothetical protein